MTTTKTLRSVFSWRTSICGMIKMISLLSIFTPVSPVEVIKLGPFVCLCVCPCWVCGSYIVHHFNGTEFCCAPSTCVVHHSHVLCTIFIICYHLDGAQCDVVSLDVFNTCWTARRTQNTCVYQYIMAKGHSAKMTMHGGMREVFERNSIFILN